MEANGAPEKLYLINDEDEVMLSYDPSTKLQYGNRYDFVDKEVFPIEKGSEVEYTQTDAFIEKASKWIIDNFPTGSGISALMYADDFKKAMKL